MVKATRKRFRVSPSPQVVRSPRGHMHIPKVEEVILWPGQLIIVSNKKFATISRPSCELAGL